MEAHRTQKSAPPATPEVEYDFMRNPDPRSNCPVLVVVEITDSEGNADIQMGGFQTSIEAMHWLRRKV